MLASWATPQMVTKSAPICGGGNDVLLGTIDDLDVSQHRIVGECLLERLHHRQPLVEHQRRAELEQVDTGTLGHVPDLDGLLDRGHVDRHLDDRWLDRQQGFERSRRRYRRSDRQRLCRWRWSVVSEYSLPSLPRAPAYRVLRRCSHLPAGRVHASISGSTDANQRTSADKPGRSLMSETYFDWLQPADSQPRLDQQPHRRRDRVLPASRVRSPAPATPRSAATCCAGPRMRSALTSRRGRRAGHAATKPWRWSSSVW